MVSVQFAAQLAVLSVIFAGVANADPSGTMIGTPLGTLMEWTRRFKTTPNYYEFNTDVNNIFYIHEYRSIAIEWDSLASSCYCRLRASKNAMSPTPGDYGAYVKGSLYSAANIADNELEGYGHDWTPCQDDKTGTTAYDSATYSGLADGYYLFTFSCTMNNQWQAEDFAFKIDNASPLTTIAPQLAGGYDPSPKSRASYSFTLTTTEYHGNTASIPTSFLPNPAYSALNVVTDATEKAGIKYHYKVDNDAAYTTVSGTTTITIPQLAPGPHCLSVKAEDLAQNPEMYDAMYCWTVETFEKTTGCTFSYALGAAEYVSTGSNGYADLSGLSDGSQSFKVKAFDMYNNPTAAADENTFTWTVDTTKPTASFTAAGTWSDTELVTYKGPTSTKGTFKYQSSEAGSFFKYQVDGGVFVTAGTTTTQTFATGTFAVSSCSATAHSFGVKAIDPVGNVGDVATSSFEVEPINTFLYLRINGLDATQNINPSSTAVFRIKAMVDTSYPSVFSYEYKIDGGAWIKGVHFPEFGIKGLADGTHTVEARAISTSGCYDPSPVVLSFQVDTTKPVTTFEPVPSPSNLATITVLGKVHDETINTAGTQYRLGSAAYSTPGNPVTTTDGVFAITLNNLVEGSYTLYAQSTDKAGLTSDEASVSWIVDFGAPETMILSGPPTPAYVDADVVFRFACSEADCTYEYDVDGTGSWTTLTTSTLKLNDISPGVHTLQVYAIDAANNKDLTPAAYTWSTYAGEMYGEYCDACSFSSFMPVDPTKFSPPSYDTVHVFLEEN
mmetsp:Transcript_22663/g.27365  ORF Transcript_22663/g.27365 Transcript_22663/m.27365 type:complete len:782 (+) Transcript_22663:48-2393(+)|eukprot:CAMPEP_0197846724 /NCGR_PEP_ID=MMETSP1438-20131217/4152_1 /TAXON_ID=1461541 /ORGANISM="Pterosperma sp., Strain CCMP1384" /LENGTH=781 /DNA_ID=CAMNT_0043458467 /DNA_START=40 /DNA_END=2385 /DNA_ORIENTATION=+